MKTLGKVLLIVGVLGFLIGFNIDTTVATGYGGRVHNIGLMNDRQAIIMFAGVMAVIGAVFVGFAGKSSQPSILLYGRSSQDADARKCPFCAEFVKAEAIVCRFCQRDLPPIQEAAIEPAPTGSSSTASVITALPSGETDSLTAEQCQIMEKFNITFDGEKFHFREYCYEKLSDAVNYARLQASKA